MSVLHGILLGIVQGLTEFLPISSSAHLVLVPYLLGWDFPAEQIFPFDVLVQLGTLVAVIVYFWKDLWSIARAWVTGLARLSGFGTKTRSGVTVNLASAVTVDFRLGLSTVAEAAIALMPCISRVRLLRHWGGVMDMTPDGSVYICKTPVQGLYMTAGWC